MKRTKYSVNADEDSSVFIFPFVNKDKILITRLRPSYSCHEDKLIGEFIRNVRNAHTNRDRDGAKCYWVIEKTYSASKRKEGFKMDPNISTLESMYFWNTGAYNISNWHRTLIVILPTGPSCNSWISSSLWEDWWQFDRKVDRVERRCTFIFLWKIYIQNIQLIS